MPLSRTARRALVALALAGVVVCVVSILSIPPDAKLGAMVRFVMFHGASTWVNMATFTLAGVLGIATVLGRAGAVSWGQAFRWLALPHWLVNTVMGVLSMQLIWGGILWQEPRFIMTLSLLAAGAVILAVQLLTDSPRIPAALDALLALALWYLVLALPNLFHPDSPVFNSGNNAYVIGFFGMVIGVAAFVGALIVLVARRGKAPQP